jgi:hypothetical protein
MYASPARNGNGRHPAHGTPQSSNRLQDLPEHATTPPPDGNPAAPEPPPEPTEKCSEGRDKRGHFNLGNPGGPGNPYARQVAALRKAMLDAVTAEDIRAVAQALLARAKEGDSAAARLLLSYTLGRPAAAADPDTLDEHEWGVWKRYSAGTDIERLIQTMPVGMALRIAREVWPVLHGEKCDLMSQEYPVEETTKEAEKARPKRSGKAKRGKRGGKATPEGGEDTSPATEEALPAEAGAPAPVGEDGAAQPGDPLFPGGDVANFWGTGAEVQESCGTSEAATGDVRQPGAALRPLDAVRAAPATAPAAEGGTRPTAARRPSANGGIRSQPRRRPPVNKRPNSAGEEGRRPDGRPGLPGSGAGGDLPDLNQP